MFRNYYNLTKPGIIYGNLLTAAAGFLLASTGHIDLVSFAAILAGTALVIGSACVCNNVIDRDIDSRMARTRKRALVSGVIKPWQALLYALVLGAAGVAILALWTNWLTVGVGVFAFAIYEIGEVFL